MMSKYALAGLAIAAAAFEGADAFAAGSTLPSTRAAQRSAACSLRMSSEEEKDSSVNTRRAVVGGLFSVLIGAQTLVPTEAEAASRSGGRVGGGFRKMSTSRTAPPKTAASATAAPAAPAPTTVNVINTAPAYGGYGGGIGYGGGFGGYGMFGPPLSPGAWMALTGLELAESFAREQRRQEFYRQQLETQRQLGKDQAAIDQLNKQIAEQDKMLKEMQAKMGK